MAQTQTYTVLLGRIESLSGASFGTDKEKAWVESLVNRRAQMAYRESDYWENFLVIGEERWVDEATNSVPYTGPTFDVSEGISDLNPYPASVDTFLRIHRKKPWVQNSVTELSFAGGPDGARLIGAATTYGLKTTDIFSASAAAGVVTVIVSDTVDTKVGSTIKLSDFSTTGFPDINGTQTVTANSYSLDFITLKFAISDTSTYSWTATLTGDESVKFPSAFCTYKKRLTATYGASDTTAIPSEWFEYIAHGVMADMLRGDQQHETAALEENFANQALIQQLERLDRQSYAQIIGNRIATHGTEQGRQTTYY